MVRSVDMGTASIADEHAKICARPHCSNLSGQSTINLFHYLIWRHRRAAQPPAGGVEDRVADRRRHADLADLAHALGAESADDAVVLLDEDNVDVVDVRV